MQGACITADGGWSVLQSNQCNSDALPFLIVPAI